ncbi:MAG: hypothetical protein A3F84_20760 [Candidatus Handelsmanbacteria bacterium RIFCSPLOWO2_12_FULL_64_10]|uniref:Uncharacterized protein n=1 Tax=Handelsmanbacteria sp. (strain RIFCSPLOWO2_12_FULL_64_10) TaxID=1817868 RepID=A0A1F6CVG0_HANXR|nr:MAG: hypothetical protein A3F84_20760 [Candidatus Handelsmanbacteria bacterium RIFCSPLOWO2_12_FULL_64_10]
MMMGLLLAAAQIVVVRRAPPPPPPVVEAAHHVHELAAALHHEAEAGAHHPGYWERAALSRLHAFEEAAGHFHAQVETFHQDPRHTEGDYAALLVAFDEARRWMPYLHAAHGIEHRFEDVAVALGGLRAFYEGGHVGVDPVWAQGRVLELAHELEETLQRALTAAVVDEEARSRRHGGKAIRGLVRSQRAAAHLHEQVERLAPDPDHTIGDLQETRAQFNEAIYRLGKSKDFGQTVAAEVSRAGQLLEEIESLYGFDAHDDHHR